MICSVGSLLKNLIGCTLCVPSARWKGIFQPMPTIIGNHSVFGISLDEKGYYTRIGRKRRLMGLLRPGYRRMIAFFGEHPQETTITGRMMSGAYEQAKNIVKDHVHAREDDVLVFCGSGMTAAVNSCRDNGT